jgi:hypothetical protein
MEAARIEAADLEQKAIQEQQNPPPKRRGRPPQQKNIAAAAAAAEAKGAKEAPQNVRQSGRGQEAAGVFVYLCVCKCVCVCVCVFVCVCVSVRAHTCLRGSGFRNVLLRGRSAT